jgi:hypothetical protein
MKEIISRLRRLEIAAAPAEKERAAIEQIEANRRRRMGADYKPIGFPPGTFDGCRTSEERMIRGRMIRRKEIMVQQATERGKNSTSWSRDIEAELIHENAREAT